MRHVEAQRLNWSHTVLVGDKQCDSALHLSVGQVVLARRRIQNSNNSCLGVNGSHALSCRCFACSAVSLPSRRCPSSSREACELLASGRRQPCKLASTRPSRRSSPAGGSAQWSRSLAAFPQGSEQFQDGWPFGYEDVGEGPEWCWGGRPSCQQNKRSL